MEKCKYPYIGAGNLPIMVSKKIRHRLDIIQCPYAMARAKCPQCGFETFLNGNLTYRVSRPRGKYIKCLFCGGPINIMRHVEVICFAGQCFKHKKQD